MKPPFCDMSDAISGCQPDGCTKGFKGKGTPRQRMRKVEAQLALVHARMRQLKVESRTMQTRHFALDLYTKRATRTMTLRWRMVRGEHALWERDIAPLLPRFPVELQAWYRKLHHQAQILNVEERCLRYVHHALKRLTERLRE